MNENEEALTALVDGMEPKQLRAFVRKQMSANEDLQHALTREKNRGKVADTTASLRQRLRACLRKVGPYDSRRVSGTLHPWLEEVEQDVLPFDPVKALKLVELLIHAPEVDHLDDSNGFVGDLLDQACLLWLQSLSRAGIDAEEIMTRLRTLYDGPRGYYLEWALSRADLVLNEVALRELARRYEDDFKMLEGLKSPEDSGNKRSRYHFTSAISLLAEALRDPDLEAHSTLLRSPEPNGMQREEIAKAYIKFDRAADALPWLVESPSWGRYESTRLELLDQVYTLLGDLDRVKALRGQSFRMQPSGVKFEHWCEVLDADERVKAMAEARELTQQTLDPHAGISIGFVLDDIKMAEATAIRLADKMHYSNYHIIQSYADKFEEDGAIAGATVCYRLLLEGILDKANSNAYGHAARYWKKLQKFCALAELPHGMEGAQAYLDRMLEKHARKSSFRKRIAVM